MSKQASGHSSLESPAAQRLSVLEQMAPHESKPEKPEEQFFAELKSWVVRAYYTSEIGLKQEMEDKGNVYQAEFAGVDVSQRE